MTQEYFEAGRQFERDVSEFLGADLVPGSGNQWYAKLDLGDKTFLFSLKWTSKDRFVLTPALFREIEDATIAPGGVGDVIGGLVIPVGGRAKLVVDLSDVVRVLSGEITRPMTRSEQRAEQARLPELMRGGDD